MSFHHDGGAACEERRGDMRRDKAYDAIGRSSDLLIYYHHDAP
jgi:hypothetical protein